MYKGWIIADPEDRSDLESIGVVVGDYNELEGTFEDCKVSDKVLETLDLFWGQFFWGLEPVEED